MVTIGSHEKEVKRLAISNDGLIVASSSLDGKVMLWNLENRQLTGLIQYPVVSPINAVAISPDKSLIATGDWNGTIILWSIPDIKILWSANVHTNKIKSISFSPDGQEFVSGGKDNNVFIFDISNNLPKTAIHDANAPVFTVKYSSDGNLIGTAGREGIIRLYTKIGDKNLNWKLQKEIHSK